MKRIEQINLPPFYIGQRVVCLQDGISQSGNSYKKGQEYIVATMFITKCCGMWKIGCEGMIQADRAGLFACVCGSTPYLVPQVPYKVMSAKFFAPIQDNFQSISLEKVLEQETKLVSAN